MPPESSPSQPSSRQPLGTAVAGNGLLLDRIAAELYHVVSMLLGEGEDTIQIVEEGVTGLDLQAAPSYDEARHGALLAAAAQAVSELGRRDAAGLAAPADDAGPASCIEDDELDAAGVSRSELNRMLSGPDQSHLRGWLEGLSLSLRTVFVLRAVAGLSSAEVAGLLGEHAGAQAQDWTPNAVGMIFRQGLCSLASQLLHASNTI